jgi:hypothetical protein
MQGIRKLMAHTYITTHLRSGYESESASLSEKHGRGLDNGCLIGSPDMLPSRKPEQGDYLMERMDEGRKQVFMDSALGTYM